MALYELQVADSYGKAEIVFSDCGGFYARPVDGQWVGGVAPLANALQLAHIVYMVGSLFVGIAFQPFILMLIGLQCGFWSYIKRIDQPGREPVRKGPLRMQVKAVSDPVAAA